MLRALGRLLAITCAAMHNDLKGNAHQAPRTLLVVFILKVWHLHSREQAELMQYFAILALKRARLLHLSWGRMCI